MAKKEEVGGVPPVRIATIRNPTIKDRDRISRAEVERALGDPETQPVIEAALQARGLTVDSLFPGGARNAIWSKTYTESKLGRFLDPVTQQEIATTDTLPTPSEYSLLHKVRERPK